MGKTFCPNVSSPEFIELKEALGENIAFLVYDRNNGHFLDYDSNGNSSKLFEDLLNYTEGHRLEAIRLKSAIYATKVDEGQVDLINNEPSINEVLELDSKSTKPKSIPAKKFKMVKKITYPSLLNRPTSAKVQLERVGGRTVYKEGFPEGSNERFILSTFFRYKGAKNQPYYPYLFDKYTPSLNQDYIDYINSLFDRRVVNYDAKNGEIVFDSKVRDAKRSEVSEDTNMPVVAEEIVGISGVEKVNTKHLDDAIHIKTNQLSILERRVSKTGGTPQMKATMKSLTVQIENLKAQKVSLTTPNILENIALEDANVIESNLLVIENNLINAKDLSNNQILELLRKLDENSTSIKGWLYIQDMMKDVDVVDKVLLREIGGTYRDFHIKYNDLLASAIVEYSNRVSLSVTKESILEAVADTSYGRTMFIDLGDSNIQLLQVVKDIIYQAEYNITQESITKANEVKEWRDTFKKEGIKEDYVIDILQQKDSNGNWTGNITGEISHEYYVERQSLLDEAIEKNNWRKYNTWVSQNSKRLTSRQLDEISKGNYASSEKLGYTKEELDIQKKLLKDYEEEKSAYETLISSKYGPNLAAVHQDLDNWEKIHSPKVFLNGEFNAGSAFLIKEKPDLKKWADKNFDKIKSNPTILGFYRFMKNRFDENNKHIGYFNHFDEFYMPEKASTLASRLKSEGLFGMTGLLASRLKKSFTNELESINSESIDVLGKPVKSIPIKMMGNKIHPSLKEKNIFEIINDHTDTSLSYRHSSQIEPITNAATDLIEEIEEIEEVTINGKKFPKQRNNKISSKKNKLENAKKQLEFAKNAHLYGQRKKVQGRLWQVDVRDESITKEQISEEKNKLIAERDAFLKKANFKEDRDKINKEYKEKIDLVGKKRADVTGSAITDNLITWTYLKVMGLNPTSAAVNMAFGINANLIYASAGVDVDSENINKAMIHMMGITARSFGANSNSELVRKTFLFMQHFKTLGVLHDSDYGRAKPIAEMITILQSKAEYFNQGSLMLGMLYFEKLIDKNGKKIQMFDAYKIQNNVLVWDVDKMGPEVKASNDYVISPDRKSVNLMRFNKHLDKVIEIVHGDYKNPMMAKETAVGQILMLFKSWMPTAVTHRFESERFDKDLMGIDGKAGRTVKGRYISFVKSTYKNEVDVLFKDTLKMMLKGIITKKAFNELSDVDRVNMIRNIKEIQQIAIIMLTMAMLKALLLDDDDEAKPMLNLAINMLSKTNADLSFFMSANSAGQVLDNLVSVASTLKDIERLISSITDLIQGSVTYESGPWRGYPKVAISAMRMIPIANSAIKVTNLSSKTIDY